MKSLSVSLLLVVLTACQEEPLAPALPRASMQDEPVVITGRIVNSASNVAVGGANVRVIEAGASVGVDETGHYRIVLPARFRGQIVQLNARAIGFKVGNSTVRLDRNTVALDVAMAVDTIRLVAIVSCTIGVMDSGSSMTTPSSTKVKRGVPAVQ